MNSEKVNAAINQLNEAQGNLRKHDAIRAIENGNYAEAIEILEDEGVDGYKLAVGSDQVRAIAEARKALYEALTEENPTVSVETEPVATQPATEQTYEDYVVIMDACDMTPEPRERWEAQKQENPVFAALRKASEPVQHTEASAIAESLRMTGGKEIQAEMMVARLLGMSQDEARSIMQSHVKAGELGFKKMDKPTDGLSPYLYVSKKK